MVGMALTERTWTENRPGGEPLVPLSEMWRFRELAYVLAERDVKVRYKQSVLGVAWAVIQPLVAVGVFTLVFDNLTHVANDGIPYPLFSLVGVAIWNYHSTTVNNGAGSLVSNSGLVTKVYFPRLLAPVSAMLPALVDLGVTAVLVALLLLLYGRAPGIEVLTVPFAVLLLVLESFAFSLWLSALQVQFRDVRHLTALGLQLWLFLSPVAYSSSAVSDQWRWLYAMNPVTTVIDWTRWAVLGSPWPGWSLLPGIFTTVVVLVSGLAYFGRAQRRFADII
jgi:ABC-2 type transport system permease protein/lipopolysaccharide transport system permease protein